MTTGISRWRQGPAGDERAQPFAYSLAMVPAKS